MVKYFIIGHMRQPVLVDSKGVQNVQPIEDTQKINMPKYCMKEIHEVSVYLQNIF